MIIKLKILSQLYHVIRVTGMNSKLLKQVQKRITSFFWYPRKMCLVSMRTLQNSVENGGLGIPDLNVISKAILVERISKILKANPPWKGQLIYRIGFTIRDINRSFASPTYVHTFKQTSVSCEIATTYREIKNRVTDWTNETFTSLQVHLSNDADYHKRANRNYGDTWLSIRNSTSDRCARDVCYLIAHDALPTCDMLTRRNVIQLNICQLCHKQVETIKHLFIECEKIRTLKRMIEKIIDPQTGRTLSEEEIIYHEGRIKMKKKPNRLVALYKHVIWTTRAKLYYGEIDVKNINATLTSTFSNRMK